jgi:hypothetical protein
MPQSTKQSLERCRLTGGFCQVKCRPNHKHSMTVDTTDIAPFHHAVRKNQDPAPQRRVPPGSAARFSDLLPQPRSQRAGPKRSAHRSKANFGIIGDGKEVAQVAMAKAWRKGDFRSGYYRDQTLMLALDLMTLDDFFGQLVRRSRKRQVLRRPPNELPLRYALRG